MPGGLDWGCQPPFAGDGEKGGTEDLHIACFSEWKQKKNTGKTVVVHSPICQLERRKTNQTKVGTLLKGTA